MEPAEIHETDDAFNDNEAFSWFNLHDCDLIDAVVHEQGGQVF